MIVFFSFSSALAATRRWLCCYSHFDCAAQLPSKTDIDQKPRSIRLVVVALRRRMLRNIELMSHFLTIRYVRNRISLENSTNITTHNWTQKTRYSKYHNQYETCMLICWNRLGSPSSWTINTRRLLNILYGILPFSLWALLHEWIPFCNYFTHSHEHNMRRIMSRNSMCTVHEYILHIV